MLVYTLPPFFFFFPSVHVKDSPLKAQKPFGLWSVTLIDVTIADFE